MNIQDSIIFFMEILGTIAFAASGAMVGIRKRMDIFGICVLGVVTAVGGGMTRDVILGEIAFGSGKTCVCRGISDYVTGDFCTAVYQT